MVLAVYTASQADVDVVRWGSVNGVFDAGLVKAAIDNVFLHGKIRFGFIFVQCRKRGQRRCIPVTPVEESFER